MAFLVFLICSLMTMYFEQYKPKNIKEIIAILFFDLLLTVAVYSCGIASSAIYLGVYALFFIFGVREMTIAMFKFDPILMQESDFFREGI